MKRFLAILFLLPCLLAIAVPPTTISVSNPNPVITETWTARIVFFITPLEGRYAETCPLSWFVESGDLGLRAPGKKYPSRVTVRMRLAVGTAVRLFIRYDGAGDFIPVSSAEGRGLGSFTASVPLRRCDSFRIRISGVGDAAIYSVALTEGEGSER